ncbi:MAG: hypothetical protein HQL26_04580 [Candidatus Omnitrophica bacterium]|nr:hypothetical protein [Candidatus Omnitrophota bacterium]
MSKHTLYELKLPSLGEGIKSATVVEWLVKEGDMVQVDDDLLEIATDKATFNVPSEHKGQLKKIAVKAGEDIVIGGKLAIIEEA